MTIVRNLSRLAVAGGVAAAVLAAAMPAQAAPADSTLVCSQYIKIESIQIPAWADCMIDAAGNLIVRVGTCVAYYEPLASPVPSNVVPATTGLADCLV
jgi:hypothetical protein